ncbi:methionyl-tRNA formyltransferase [Colwellia sp. 6_MG-2023]|jgi:methionyl-tRNA formyltransferase|uniref:methionyl-tRNA formyltransferase n=1 Tax=Colwellia sp. 6_MG-2023 TaxID=3062676 RepID=UPI0026E1A268|nr:methionyl-tRNA formyltransferase [Colwellia sp. 6_MG-2023]MDO6488130.1 methionyl-tRNA formyltransferase [Colwellia sp. 6_MG-2023]
MNNYVVATIKEWNINEYKSRVSSYPGNWFLIDDKIDLTIEYLRKLKPKYIFFPHWSWIVPENILNEFTCVCFHMTDVPYGRGGSPLQNLIIRGHEDTKLTALQMVKELDAGPVFLKEKLSLKGNATNIFKRSSLLTFDMIEYIVEHEPIAVPQTGTVTEFPRRKPEQSKLTEDISLEDFYNTIRMLDAESYPKAYIKFGNIKLEFSSVSKSNDGLQATVNIFKEENND